MGAVQTLKLAIRLGVSHPRLDVGDTGRLNESMPLSAEKLAAPIMDQFGFARPTVR